MTQNCSIRVGVVEDDMSFLHALVTAVEAAEGMVLDAAASTRAEGLRILEQAPCTVLVVDLGLPDGSGIDIIRAAAVRWPDCAVMVSTCFGDELHVMRSIEAGAAGYLLKHAEPSGLIDEIRSIASGGSPISPLIARQMLQRFRDLAPSADPAQQPLVPELATSSSPQSRLSPREQQVLELFTKGFTADEIAGLIAVSHHTVLTFIRRIYRKLNVNSRAEAIHEARALGLLG